MKQQLPLAAITNILIALVTLFSAEVDVAAFSSNGPLKYSHLKYARENIVLNGRREKNDEVTGYVPSGLTAKQYAQIKEAELEKKKKMDYGAWGPKFARSDRPDGDWMIVPSLWTSGFSSNSPSSGQPQSSTGSLGLDGRQKKRNIAQLLILGLKKNVPIYAYAALLVEMFAATIHIITADVSISLAAIVQRQITKRTVNAIVSPHIIVKLMFAKMIVAGFLVKPIGYIVEKVNRRLLWSPRRTMAYTFLVSLTMLSITTLVKTVAFTV